MRISAVSPISTSATSSPGKRRERRPSAISQPQATARQGLRNSEGWSDMPGSTSQRRAPLISGLRASVAAVSASAPKLPSAAKRNTQRGVSMDVPTSTATARLDHTTWRRMKA